jgi:hypothetical protein
LDEWRLIVAELDAGAKVSGGAWNSLVPHQRQRSRCPSCGIALGDHLREEQLASTAACSTSTPCSTPGERPAADEHPLLGEHPLAASMRIRDEEESHRLHDGEIEETKRGDGIGEDKCSHLIE